MAVLSGDLSFKWRLVWHFRCKISSMRPPARTYGVAFGIYIVEGPTHAHIFYVYSGIWINRKRLEIIENNRKLIQYVSPPHLDRCGWQRSFCVPYLLGGVERAFKHRLE
jgi:hypothetical protein